MKVAPKTFLSDVTTERQLRFLLASGGYILISGLCVVMIITHFNVVQGQSYGPLFSPFFNWHIVFIPIVLQIFWFSVQSIRLAKQPTLHRMSLVRAKLMALIAFVLITGSLAADTLVILVDIAIYSPPPAFRFFSSLDQTILVTGCLITAVVYAKLELALAEWTFED